MSDDNITGSSGTHSPGPPARYALAYLLAGSAWILLTDTTSALLSSSLQGYEYISIAKGFLFVAITSALMYLLLRSHSRQVAASRLSTLKAEEEIAKLSFYDRETGLPNHNLLIDRLNQTLALNRRKHAGTAVIYISLTGFKSIVDIQGYNGGCRVMRDISDRLTAAIRQYDTVARIHRDEFALILGGSVQEGDISIILHKLLTLFATPLQIDDCQIPIPACFGISCYPTDGDNGETLLQRAHLAMNQARQNGLAFQYYSEEINRKAIDRHHIENRLLRALDAGEFFLCYQPKMDVSSSSIVGMEALVRWNCPGRGVIPPDQFISVAEENGSIVRLGEWVLREACRQNAAWQKNGITGLKVAVNLSGRQLRDNAFLPLVMQILAETGLDPRLLELELTESTLMGDSSESIGKLLRLRDLGISISVDDFGTGYSSLSYLKHLPLDTIKIDRSFVRDIVNDPDDAAIVEAIVAMANSLKLTVIAEGVETREQLEFLKLHSCRYAQGYYFSRPLDVPQFEAFVSQGLLAGGMTVSTPDHAPTPAVTPADGDSTHLPPATMIPDDSVAAAEYIGDIAEQVVPANPGDNLSAVLKRFQSDQALRVLPIVEDSRAVGIINRSTFLEDHVIGINGYAYHINHSKKMRDLMEPVLLTFDAGTSIREAATAIQESDPGIRIDNICITRKGSYFGIVEINRFVNAITEINLTLAKGANPLTGLPGNESIQREINARLEKGSDFDIAYIDIDNFKPYNDHYGFQRGDVVIKTIGETLTEVTKKIGPEFCCFCGHIGGDDFIVISGAHHGEYIASQVISSLEDHLEVFHGAEDCAAGRYRAVNRKGEQETFGLISISIGIVNTRLTPVTSYAQLASLSTEVKKAAKKLPGSSIVVNRRVDSILNRRASCKSLESWRSEGGCGVNSN